MSIQIKSQPTTGEKIDGQDAIQYKVTIRGCRYELEVDSRITEVYHTCSTGRPENLCQPERFTVVKKGNRWTVAEWKHAKQEGAPRMYKVERASMAGHVFNVARLYEGNQMASYKVTKGRHTITKKIGFHCKKYPDQDHYHMVGWNKEVELASAAEAFDVGIFVCELSRLGDWEMIDVEDGVEKDDFDDEFVVVEKEDAVPTRQDIQRPSYENDQNMSHVKKKGKDCVMM